MRNIFRRVCCSQCGYRQVLRTRRPGTLKNEVRYLRLVCSGVGDGCRSADVETGEGEPIETQCGDDGLDVKDSRGELDILNVSVRVLVLRRDPADTLSSLIFRNPRRPTPSRRSVSSGTSKACFVPEIEEPCALRSTSGQWRTCGPTPARSRFACEKERCRATGHGPRRGSRSLNDGSPRDALTSRRDRPSGKYL